MRKLIVGSLFALGLGASALPAAAAVYVEVAPPAPRYEVVPAPRVGHVWVPGHWQWRGHHHVWVRGYWMRERPGYVYAPARWVDHGGRWAYEDGRWNPHRDSDHDGVPNRYDRSPYDPYRR